MTKNTKNDHIMLQISLESVFVYFRYKMVENKANLSKTEHGWDCKRYRIDSTHFLRKTKKNGQEVKAEVNPGNVTWRKTWKTKPKP